MFLVNQVSVSFVKKPRKITVCSSIFDSISLIRLCQGRGLFEYQKTFFIYSFFCKRLKDLQQSHLNPCRTVTHTSSTVRLGPKEVSVF